MSWTIAHKDPGLRTGKDITWYLKTKMGGWTDDKLRAAYFDDKQTAWAIAKRYKDDNPSWDVWVELHSVTVMTSDSIGERRPDPYSDYDRAMRGI